jgi:hypothetical protein
MKTVYTALIGNYEELKEPTIITPGWKYVCYTDQPLQSRTWQIKKIIPTKSGSRTAREIKLLFHNYVKTKYSMWVDASFQINCNLEWWWNRFQPPFTVIKHPMRHCVYKEAEYCKIASRGNKDEINKQIARFYKEKIPSQSYLIQSGILMRERTDKVIGFCEQWHDELERGSTRDQIAFVYAASKNPVHHLTHWDYRTSTEFIYTKHYKYRK